MRQTWTAALGALALTLTAAGCGDKGDEGPAEEGDDDGGGVGGDGTGEGSGSGEGGDGAVGDCVDVVIGTDIGEAVVTGSTVDATDDLDACDGGGGWSDEGSDDESTDVGGSSGGGEEPPPDSGVWPDTGGGYRGGAPDHTIQWTAPADGWYTIYTLGSSFDTMLEIHAESCDGEWLDCDDDGGRDLDSLIQLSATGGATYLITVDGYGGSDYGPYVLNIVEGRTWLDGGDSGWSDEGSDGWDSGVSVEPEPDSDAGSALWPGLAAAWLALMGLGGVLSGRRQRR